METEASIIPHLALTCYIIAGIAVTMLALFHIHKEPRIAKHKQKVTRWSPVIAIIATIIGWLLPSHGFTIILGYAGGIVIGVFSFHKGTVNTILNKLEDT